VKYWTILIGGSSITEIESLNTSFNHHSPNHQRIRDPRSQIFNLFVTRYFRTKGVVQK
jgi:hypothetical protein